MVPGSGTALAEVAALAAAVFSAYGWDPAISDEELLERLLRLNLERGAENR
jgi:hypothetical protein